MIIFFVVVYLLFVFVSYGIIFDFWLKLHDKYVLKYRKSVVVIMSLVFATCWYVTLILAYVDANKNNIDLEFNLTGQGYK